MYLSNRHKEVEEEFSKLGDAERTPKVYVAMCRAAKIRESAIENRLSALQLFTKKKLLTKPGAKKDAVTKDDDPETAARKRNDERRRAWEAEFEDVAEGDDLVKD